MSDKEENINFSLPKNFILSTGVPFNVIGVIIFMECLDENEQVTNEYLLKRGMKPENLMIIQEIMLKHGMAEIVHDEHETVN